MLFIYKIKYNGFNLIELMIAIAIIGILAAIAYPQYADFVQRSNRSEAQRELLRIANIQERLYADIKNYTDNMISLGLNADPFITESGFYSIDAQIENNNTRFTLTATALSTQASRDSECLNLVVNELGTKTATSPHCWE